MRPVDWDELARICEAEGYKFRRMKGDHYIMTKPGMTRPVVIPKKRGLKEDIVLGVGRTIGLDRKALDSKLTLKNKGSSAKP